MILDVLASVYFILICLLVLGYVVVFFGLGFVSLAQILVLRQVIQGLISVYLLLRFHPFQQAGKMALQRHDMDIVFASALFLFFNVFVESALVYAYLPPSLQNLLNQSA
jgi:hypothetical protein